MLCVCVFVQVAVLVVKRVRSASCWRKGQAIQEALLVILVCYFQPISCDLYM